jgi:hypothetical protein
MAPRGQWPMQAPRPSQKALADQPGFAVDHLEGAFGAAYFAGAAAVAEILIDFYNSSGSH